MAGFTVDYDEIDNRLGFHPATNETKIKHYSVRVQMINIARFLVDELPEGREKSLALTALQECSMWSNAAIACNLAPLKLGE